MKHVHVIVSYNKEVCAAALVHSWNETIGDYTV